MKNSLPKIHGHRGARGRRPENTLNAVKFAIDSGADGVEVDLCVTADNIVVLHHDLALSPSIAIDIDGNRITTSCAIRTQPYTELLHYDVGQLDKNSAYGQKFPQQLACPGTSVPTLEMFIQYVLDHGSAGTVFNLELKGSPDRAELLPEPINYVKLVADQIKRHGIASRTFIQSFDWALVRLMREELPEITTGVLTDMQPNGDPRIPLPGVISEWTDNMILDTFNGSVPRMVAASSADVWSSNFRDLTPELVTEAKNLGLDVYVWTVNDCADMEAMIAMGVDVITTDYPDRLLSLGTL